MTRDEHLDWAKARALEYVDRGEITDALASMLSDLAKHDELKNHIGIKLGVQLAMIGSLASREQMRHFIVGFR